MVGIDTTSIFNRGRILHDASLFSWRRRYSISFSSGWGSGRIRWLVLRESLGLVAAGVVLGMPGALGLSRFVESLLYGVSPTDGATLAAAGGLMCAVAFLASILPANRATGVDPAVALRCE